MNLQRVDLKTRFQWIEQCAQRIKDSKKIKKDKLYVKKAFLGKIRGEQSLSIFLLDLDTISVLIPTVFSLQISRSLSPWRISYIIQSFLDDLDPPFVDHAGHYSSASPIKQLPKPFMRCGNQGSTIQGSSPHKCGQEVWWDALNVVEATILLVTSRLTPISEALSLQYNLLW